MGKINGTTIGSSKPYTLETWVSIRVLFESGKFTSLTQLHEYCQKNLPCTPSLHSIKLKAGKEHWDKNINKNVLADEKTQNFKELFAELSLDEKRTAQVIVEGVLCAEKSRDRILEFISTEGLGVFEDVEKLSQLSKLIQSHFKNMNIAHKYIELKLKLCGEFPSDKKCIKTDDNNIHENYNPLDSMTDDEIEAELSRLTLRSA